MNQEYDKFVKNNYEGNGWSKYQLLVLQQLEEHNTILSNCNKEITNIKQMIAVNDAENKMWKSQTEQHIELLQEDLHSILHDEKGINKRLLTVENDLEVESQYSTKQKATWALYGTILMVVLNAGIQIVGILLKK